MFKMRARTIVGKPIADDGWFEVSDKDWLLQLKPIAFWESISLAGEQSLAIFVVGFLAFYVVALPACRVLMVWVYDLTASLLVDGRVSLRQNADPRTSVYSGALDRERRPGRGALGYRCSDRSSQLRAARTGSSRNVIRRTYSARIATSSRSEKIQCAEQPVAADGTARNH